MMSRVRLAALGGLLTLGLSGCWLDEDTDPPEVVATADTFTLAAGQTGDLLANDSFEGGAATVGSAGNVSFAITTGAPPAGMTIDAGVVNVADTTVPGTYGFSYTLCETGDAKNCSTAAVQVTVPQPEVVATDDSFNLGVGNSGDVLANDTVGGAPASATTVSASATALPTGVTLSASGVIAVEAGAVAGTYPIEYSICLLASASTCDSATVTVIVPEVGTLTGRAIDAATGLGVPDVVVSVGGVSTTTDASGNFTLTSAPPGDRLSVVFDSATYGQTVRVTALAASGNADVQARLVRVSATAQIDAATGGTVTVPGSTAQVVLPANGLQNADGSPASGSVTVKLTVIDPASDSSVMPGDFTTLASGTPTLIESFGALNVELTDAAGAPLNLAAGQSATLRIAVASRNASRPATIPLYYFDNATGRWVEEGTATLVGSGASAYYEGTVTHFTTWNADQVYNTVRISGCVADAAGVPVAGAYVAADGVDYTGTSSAYTDANGNFVLPMRLGSVAIATGVSNGLLTNTLRVGPYSVDTTLTACLALGQTGAGITMKLTWGALPSDLDSHLFAPNGSHVYYSSKGSLISAPFANLDVDDTSSYGPEVVTVTRLMVGTYKYSVYNYSGFSRGPLASSGARVELNMPGRTPELFAPPASGESISTDWWNLFEFDVDASCNVTVRRVGSYSVAAPTVTAGEPVYCTAP